VFSLAGDSIICNQDILQISIGYPKAKTPPPDPEAGPFIHAYAFPLLKVKANIENHQHSVRFQAKNQCH